MRLMVRFALFLFVFSWLELPAADSTITLRTAAIERQVMVRNGHVQTARITNRFTGETLAAADEEFALQFFVGGWKNSSFDPNPKYVTSREFIVQTIQPFTAGDTSGYRVSLTSSHGVALVIRYYTRNNHPELYKDLEIINQTGYPILIDFVEVEHWRSSIPTPAHQGFGQPVYAGNFYMGIAYPTGYNFLTNGVLFLKHFAGKSLPPNTSYRSHPAIIGAAPRDQVETAFLQYIERIKAQPTRPFLLYNSWYDIRRLTDENCARTIKEFQQFMVEPYGLTLDAFVLDDGWDQFQSCWDIAPDQFPQKFTIVQQQLNTIQSHLGLWASPWGGYDKRRQIRVEWAKRHGLETSGDMLCIAGTRYFQCFKEKLLRYQREFGVKFFKLDGLLTRCNAPNHGHLPGIYSQEAAVDHFVQLMQAMRQQDPSVFIDITVGTWLSPWWLQYADCVWMTGADYAYTQSLPLFSERDKAITYRDQVLHDNYKISRYQFPFSALMTHGIIKGRLNLLGGKNETVRDFTNNAVIYFSRGVMMWELYITPSILSRAEWDNLAQTIRWAYDHAKLLQHTRFVLGDPGKGEIYGYLHNDGHQVLVTLRNPAIYPQEVSLPLRRWIPDAWQGNSLLLEIRYPYLMNRLIQPQEMDSTYLQLQGNEILVLKILPQMAEPLPLPLNVRYQEKKEKNNTTIILFSDSVASSIEILRPRHSRIRVVHGKARIRKMQSSFRLVPEQTPSHTLTVNNAQLTVTPSRVSLQFTVKGNAKLKNSRLLALWESPQPLDTLHARIYINGVPEEPQVRRDGEGKWWWIAVPINQPAAVTLEIQHQQVPLTGTISAILDVTLQEQEILRYAITAPRLKRTPTALPYFGGEHRRTIPIIQRTTFTGVGKD